MDLSSRYKENWAETQERFELWWQRKPMNGPLLRVTAPRQKPLNDAPQPQEPPLPAKYLDTDYMIREQRYALDHTYFGGDAAPMVGGNLGPGSLSLYLGSEPVFDRNTVWYEPCIESLETGSRPNFDQNNAWFRKHLEITRKIHDDFRSDACTTIPDLVESLDILAAMRGPTKLLYDLADSPQHCHRWLKRINELYAPYYDAFYDLVKEEDGSSSYTAFGIWGRGKTCKVQCDFSAMISPDCFGEFFVPYLKEQMKRLDRVLYHLDGANAIRHVDPLIRLEKLNAIQWTAGAGAAPSHDERWHPLYRKILDAGKGLQVGLQADKVLDFIRRFGSQGVMLMTWTDTEREARDLVAATRRS